MSSPTNLGDVIAIRRGISWEASQEFQTPGTGRWPVLGIPNVQKMLVLEPLVYVKPAGGRADARKIATRGTILMVGSNGNPQRVGNAVFIEDDDSAYLFGSFLIGVNVRDPSQADPKFVFHLIASPATQDKLTRAVRGSTGLHNLSQAALQGIDMPTVALSEQRKIAEVLDTVDEAIRKTEAIISKLKQVKQGLLHDLLTRGIDDNGELRDPERHPEQFKDSPLGRIPKEWEVATLDGVRAADTPISYGVLKPGDFVPGGVPLLQIADVIHRGLDLSMVHRIGTVLDREYSRTRVVGGELVVSLVGTIGRVARLPEEMGPANLHRNLGLVRIRSVDCSPSFYLHVLRSGAAQRQIRETTLGTTQSLLNLGALRGLVLPKPPPSEQQAIAARAASFEHREEREHSALAKLRLLKQGLMEDLLTGRVRVTELLEASNGPGSGAT